MSKKYELAQIVRRSIGARVAREARLVMGVAKKGTKLKTVRRRVEHKELEHQCQPQFSNLQSKGGIINHGKVEPSHLYQETPSYPFSIARYTL